MDLEIMVLTIVKKIGNHGIEGTDGIVMTGIITMMVTMKMDYDLTGFMRMALGLQGEMMMALGLQG